MTTSPAYLVDSVRTPFGRHRGGLSHVRTDDLASLPLRELLTRHSTLSPESIQDVLYGDTNGAGEDNRNVARMAVLLAGLPSSVPGATVNRLCGSGAEALVQAARAIRSGDADLVVAGGVESMSRAPFVIPSPSRAQPANMEIHQSKVGWRMVNPRFPAHWTVPLGAAADAVAAELGVTREQQDQWALRSHQRATEAWDSGLFDAHVMAVEGVDRDESLRPDTTLDKLAALPAAFVPDGAVTAGNASPLNDGAMATLVASQRSVEALGVEPLGKIVGSSVVGVEPHRFAVAPVPAVRQVVERTGIDFDEFSVIEINEAFAAMVLSTLAQLPELDRGLVNPNGGAIAIGHPLGASALRVVVDCCRELRRRGGGLGLAMACIGVGQGIAVVCEA